MEPTVGVGLSLAKTADATGQEGVKLLSRVLGPTADVLGNALASWTQTRIDNIGNITARAERKARGRHGAVNARVAHQVIDDGSYVDDEVMAEYYAGILAASKSEDGRDDMGQPWVAMLSAMSSVQVRLHFVLYRAWASALFETGHDLKFDQGRVAATIRVDLLELFNVLGYRGGDANAFTGHATSGLISNGLAGPVFKWGPVEDDARGIKAALEVQPTMAGMDLYGWAVGAGPTSPDAFGNLGSLGAEAGDVPMLRSFLLPRLGLPSSPAN